MGQQEIHEHEALGGGFGRRLYCRLTSLSRSLQTILRINLDGTRLTLQSRCQIESNTPLPCSRCALALNTEAPRFVRTGGLCVSTARGFRPRLGPMEFWFCGSRRVRREGDALLIPGGQREAVALFGPRFRLHPFWVQNLKVVPLEPRSS